MLLGEPPLGVIVKLTCPDGVTGVPPLLSVTVTVQSTTVPILAGLGLQLTDVLVERRTVTLVDAPLVTCPLSPW
jgi:hypothetical protein